MNEIEAVYPPGKYIRDALVERGWAQGDLAYVMNRTPADVSELILGKKRVTPEIAQELAVAFSNEPQYWLDIVNKYNLSQLEAVDSTVVRRSRLYNTFPVKEMIKRGWIETSDDINELEGRFLRFFQIDSIDEQPQLRYAARKSGSYTYDNAPQSAWILRAEQLAKAVQVKTFSDIALETAIKKLRLLLTEAEEIRHVPKILAEAGVRILIIEPLTNAKIDGITFWLDNRSPVIALSLRYDRIDAFWHTLFHELSHVKNREGQDSPIVDFFDDDPNARPPREVRADKDAARFSIPDDKLDSFILRVHPSYTRQKILGFAALNKVHPGIVVGQLHHRFQVSGKGLPFSHQRNLLVKVRHLVTGSTLTDGWGHKPLIHA